MSTKMVATRNEISDKGYLLKSIYQSFETNKYYEFFSKKKKIAYNLIFKNTTTILIQSYELKFLSRCHLQCWITINSSWI